MRPETAERLRRPGLPKNVRTRLADLPPGKALASRLVNGELVWRIVPATVPPANPELEAAKERVRRAVARMCREQAIRKHRAIRDSRRHR